MKIKIIITLMIFVSLLTSLSCSLLLDDAMEAENLRIPAKDYTGKELRTDGYYYHLLNDSIGSHYIFLYRNGVIYRSPGGISFKNSLTVEENLDNSVSYLARTMRSKERHEHRANWGAFEIQANDFRYEVWGHYNKRQVYAGKIINDTTFVLTYGQGNTINKKYCFRPFSPLPDSTNNFLP